jgi:predicted alpha/beta-hydrolase family hydrolase
MDVEPRTVDLGPCPGVSFDQGGAAWVVILPGAMYSPEAPLLWFARRAALAAGRNVLTVVDAFDREQNPVTWVEARLEAALANVHERDAHPVVIGKSLTSLAASIAARDHLPAVWLTPLIAAGHPVTPMVVAAMHAGTAPRLLVGGLADPSWDGEVARSFTDAEVLELEGADHGLEDDDIAASAANLATVAGAIQRFLERLR